MQHGCACNFEKNALRHVNEFVFLSEPIKIQGGRCNTSSLSKERPDQLLVCERFLFGLSKTLFGHFSWLQLQLKTTNIQLLLVRRQSIVEPCIDHQCEHVNKGSVTVIKFREDRRV